YLVSYSSIANDDDMLANYRTQYKTSQGNQLFPHNKLAEYLSGALCLLSTILLGIFDDLFDIRWRHKFFLPAVASLPLLIVYYVDFSVTSIVVPGFITKSPAGVWVLIAFNQVFQATNSFITRITGLKFTTLAIDYDINTGINGLEVGQSIVLGYPSQVFVGDTYCYFSGMVFAVVDSIAALSPKDQDEDHAAEIAMKKDLSLGVLTNSIYSLE
ncbi:tunicamycin resistance protein, partial [Candidozyma auris]